MKAGLTFQGFSAINNARCRDGFKHDLASWSASDWMVATMGELGEAANVLKKLNRERDGIKGNTATATALRAQLRREIADTFIYLDLMSQALGFDQSTGRPVGYLHVGTNLELFPTPDAAYTVRLRYVPEMTPLAADGDSIDVPNGWEGFIVHSILLRCDEREERSLTDRKDSIERYRARIVRASQNRNTAEPAYLPMPWEGSSWPG